MDDLAREVSENSNDQVVVYTNGKESKPHKNGKVVNPDPETNDDAFEACVAAVVMDVRNIAAKVVSGNWATMPEDTMASMKSNLTKLLTTKWQS